MRQHRLLAALLTLAALLAFGASTASADFEAPVILPPSAGGGNVSPFPNCISVNWYHSGSGVVGFSVEREHPYWGRDDIGAGQRSLLVCGMEPSTTYRFRVCAYFGTEDGDSECAEADLRTGEPETPPPPPPSSGGGSSGGTQTPAPLPPLTPPTNLQVAVDRSGTSATIRWQRGTGGDAGVYYDRNPPDFIDCHDTAAPAGVLCGCPTTPTFESQGCGYAYPKTPSHTFTNLQIGHTYTVQVCTLRNLGDNQPYQRSCASVRFTTSLDVTQPLTPGGVTTVSAYAPELAVRVDGFTTVSGATPERFLVIVSNNGRTGSDSVEFVVAFDGTRLLPYDVLATAPGFACQRVQEGFRCSGSLDGRGGPRHEASFVVRGWGAALGPSTVTATVDPANRVAETDESNNTSRFTTTVVDPASAPERCSRSATPAIGRRCTNG